MTKQKEEKCPYCNKFKKGLSTHKIWCKENPNPDIKKQNEIREKKSGKNNSMFGKFGKNHPSYGLKRSKETKKLQSEKRKEYLKNHPEAMKGKNNPQYGKKTFKKNKKINIRSDVWRKSS